MQNSESLAEGTALPPMELVCPAGSLPALKAAVDNGADCVYLGLRDATNARNFAGLNFDEAAIANRHSPTRMSGAARCCWPSTLILRPPSPAGMAQGHGQARPTTVSTPSSWPTRV
jgi:hypothetical protein